MKYCQGPKCHEYKTKDRIRGSKGDKHYETRKRSSFYYGNGNFCDQRCLYDWVDKYIERGLNHFGRTTKVKHLTEQNAWRKDYNYNGYRNLSDEYYFVNTITKEQRPLTKAQYDDKSYTLNER